MNQQLDLFSPDTPAPGELLVPGVVRAALEGGATLAISISGGKDSHALLIELTRYMRENNYYGQLYAVHADLGRAEWHQTPAFVERICEEHSVELVVVQRTNGDMVERFEQRLQAVAGTDAPFWSSSANRYCTSDMKRGPIDTALRNDLVVISAEGVRADESMARAKKPVVQLRTGITATALRNLTPEQALQQRTEKQRVALNWRPLLHWSEADIWRSIGTSERELRARQAIYRLGDTDAALQGWPAHPAYIIGNQRLSCALCVLGSKSDLLNGANHNPELYRTYLDLERAGNATFKNGWSLAELPVTGEAARLRDEWLNEHK